jgi:hypothetical protein
MNFCHGNNAAGLLSWPTKSSTSCQYSSINPITTMQVKTVRNDPSNASDSSISLEALSSASGDGRSIDAYESLRRRALAITICVCVVWIVGVVLLLGIHSFLRFYAARSAIRSLDSRAIAP